MLKKFKSILQSKQISIGTWSQMASSELVEILGFNGFEFTIIDCEHSSFGVETVENLSRACDSVGIGYAVRVEKNDATLIMKLLDAGCKHVVVPNVSTREQAEYAVASTRFAPNGLRGACPCVRAGAHHIRDWKKYVSEQEAQVEAIALVETSEGYHNFKKLVSVKNLNTFMFGPFDLSVSMGLNGDWRHKKVQDAVREMVNMAIDAGGSVIMPIFSPYEDECKQTIDEWHRHGVNTFIVGTDKIIIANAICRWNEILRKILPVTSRPES